MIQTYGKSQCYQLGNQSSTKDHFSYPFTVPLLQQQQQQMNDIVDIACCQYLNVVLYSDNTIVIWGQFSESSPPFEQPYSITCFKSRNKWIKNIACTRNEIYVCCEREVYQIRIRYSTGKTIIDSQSYLNSYNSCWFNGREEMTMIKHDEHTKYPIVIWRSHSNENEEAYELIVNQIQLPANTDSIRKVMTGQSTYFVQLDNGQVYYAGVEPFSGLSTKTESLLRVKFPPESEQQQQQVDDNDTLAMMIESGTEIRDITCTKYYCILLTSDYKVFTSGCGLNYQLGHRDQNSISTDRFKPVYGIDNEDVIRICSCERFVVVLTRSGRVYYWGEICGNFFPSATLLHVSSSFTEITCNCSRSFVIGTTQSNQLFCIGDYHHFTVKDHITLVNDFISEIHITDSLNQNSRKLNRIACGYHHLLLLMVNSGSTRPAASTPTTTTSMIHHKPDLKELTHDITLLKGLNAISSKIMNDGDDDDIGSNKIVSTRTTVPHKLYHHSFNQSVEITEMSDDDEDNDLDDPAVLLLDDDGHLSSDEEQESIDKLISSRFEGMIGEEDMNSTIPLHRRHSQL